MINGITFTQSLNYEVPYEYIERNKFDGERQLVMETFSLMERGKYYSIRFSEWEETQRSAYEIEHSLFVELDMTHTKQLIRYSSDLEPFLAPTVVKVNATLYDVIYNWFRRVEKKTGLKF